MSGRAARPVLRRMALIAALAATVAASIWAGSVDDESPAPRAGASPELLAALPARSSAAGRAAQDDAGIDWKLPARATTPAAPRNPFVPVTPPPPPVRKLAPVEAPPQAPPLPFIVIGQMTAEGERALLLSQGTLTHVAKIGTQLGEFRLESVQGDTFTFIHGPTGLTQTLQATR